MTISSCLWPLLCGISLLCGEPTHLAISDVAPVTEGTHSASTWERPRADSLLPPAPWDSTEWSGRVIVGEYWTGIFCPPCQEHELAFDSLHKRYPTKVFIPLAYHGAANIPIADPVHDMWQEIYSWYGDPGNLKASGILPRDTSVSSDDWINGHGGIPASNVYPALSQRYAILARVIDSALRTPPRAALRIQAVPKGGNVVARVIVDSLSSASTTLAVRILLVEDTVRLILDPKGNPLHARPKVEHYMVVRSNAYSAKLGLGLPLKVTNGRGAVTYTFNVARVQRNLLRNRALGLGAIPGLLQGTLPGMETEESKQFLLEEFKQIVALFPDRRNWTIDPTRLHVVALVQDVTTREILQAQMIPLKNGPHGERLTL